MSMNAFLHHLGECCESSERAVTGKIKGSREGDSKLLNSHTDESKHGDTSVLDLNSTTASST